MLHSVRAVYAAVAARPRRRGRRGRVHNGLRQLTDIFLDCLVENIEDRLRTGDRPRALRSARLLAAESPERLRQAVSRIGTAASLC